MSITCWQQLTVSREFFKAWVNRKHVDESTFREGLSILAGTNTLSSGGIKVKVAKIVPHEDYGNFMNDIAVMRLETPLNFTESIKPIEVLQTELEAGKIVYISGWGKTSNMGQISDRLKFNYVKSMSDEKCGEKTGILEGLICLSHDSNNGACNVSRLLCFKAFLSSSRSPGRLRWKRNVQKQARWRR